MAKKPENEQDIVKSNDPRIIFLASHSKADEAPMAFGTSPDPKQEFLLKGRLSEVPLLPKESITGVKR